MARGSVLPSVLFFAASAASASAAIECRQENAIYGDRDGAYELRFEAVDSEAANSSYQLRVSVKNTGIELTGFVMETEPVNRPSGILFHDCPDGDMTGEEIARCTVWQGVIYSANEGRIDLLPVAGAPAARCLPWDCAVKLRQAGCPARHFSALPQGVSVHSRSFGDGL